MKADAIREAENGIATRLAQRALAKREASYASEVRRLLDAGLDLMRDGGATSRPRVADIVAAAGLSNEAFYRHFPSKQALFVAILEDGADRLGTYLAHQMSKASTPEGKVRRWVEGVLDQAADAEIAATTLAVLGNAGNGGDEAATGHSSMNPALAVLLQEPFAALGSPDPVLDAALATNAAMGHLTDCLRRRVSPSPDEIAHVADFCLRAVGGTPKVGGRRA